MDADFSHNPDDLIKLYQACHDEGADLSVGSRYCNGIAVKNWPIGRIIMSYGASLFVRTVLHIKIFDTTAGFVCYKKELLNVNSNEYSIIINYNTTTKCEAIQWLNPNQTLGKQYPYLFSQCQAIHARSFLPIPTFTSRCEKICSITKIPLRVCIAITIHKTQGMTIGPGEQFEKIVV